MSTATSRLTETDRALITRAGDLAALDGSAAVCGHAGNVGMLFAYVDAFGEAQELLRGLAAIIGRMEGDQ